MQNINSTKKQQQVIKVFNDYGPVLVFFIAYLTHDLMTATAALIISTFIGLCISLYFLKKLPIMPLVTALIVGIFGGLTLWLNDSTFIKMKPTIIQAIMSLILFTGLIFKKPLLKPLLGHVWPMLDKGWKILTLRFAIFFATMSILNEIIWRTQSTDFWVNFKVIGIMVLTFIFICTQIPLIEKYMKHNSHS